MARRIKIGDIIEIKTDKGLVYAQYTHKNSLMGNLIRVFTGFYKERPISFEGIVNGDIRFMTFFPLQTKRTPDGPRARRPRPANRSIVRVSQPCHSSLNPSAFLCRCFLQVIIWFDSTYKKQ